MTKTNGYNVPEARALELLVQASGLVREAQRATGVRSLEKWRDAAFVTAAAARQCERAVKRCAKTVKETE